MKTIRISKRFYEDHRERWSGSHSTIDPLRETKRHYYLAAADSLALRFLVWDAEYYADFWQHEGCGIMPLCHSAWHTVRAIKKTMGWDLTADLPIPLKGGCFNPLKIEKGDRR